MGRLETLLKAGRFVITAEINPPKSANAGIVTRRAGVLKGYVDAANVTDSNRAQVAMSSLAAALFVRDAGVEPIVQMTGRDRNRIALQSDLLGGAALGLPNFVFMSGDDPKQGNHPEAVNVKDLDGLGLLKAAVGMRDRHAFISGDEIRQPPVFFVGATASPFAVPMEADVKKTVEKAAAGADFLQTQPVFDVEGFGVWLRAIRAAGAAKVAIIAGVFILRSGDQAERMAKVPGVSVPSAIVERMRAAADAEREGVAIAVETIAKLRAQGGAQGVHLYAIEWPEAIPLAVESAGLFPRPEA